MGAVIIRCLILASAILMPMLAWAQDMPNYCSMPLDMRSDPGKVADWRMRCTIQKLDAERAEAEDKATQMEVNGAVSEVHLDAVRANLEEANKRAKDKSDYWQKYVAGLKSAPETALYWQRYVTNLKFSPDIAVAINKSCAWRGWFTEPTAKMCRLWHDR